MDTAILKYSLRLPTLKLNWNVPCFIGFFTIIFLLFFYVYSINELTEGAYSIKNYEKQTNNLLQKNKGLEVEFAKSGFLGNLDIKTKELSFEKTQKIKYIQIQASDNSVAVVK